MTARSDDAIRGCMIGAFIGFMFWMGVALMIVLVVTR